MRRGAAADTRRPLRVDKVNTRSSLPQGGSPRKGKRGRFSKNPRIFRAKIGRVGWMALEPSKSPRARATAHPADETPRQGFFVGRALNPASLWLIRVGREATLPSLGKENPWSGRWKNPIHARRTCRRARCFGALSTAFVLADSGRAPFVRFDA